MAKTPVCLKCGKEVTDAADVVKHREGLCGACWALALVTVDRETATAAKEKDKDDDDIIRYRFRRDDTCDEKAANPATPDPTDIDKQLLSAVRTAVHDLGYKGVDCQVFASTVDPKTGETVTSTIGIGNIHARRGMVSAWLERQMQIERNDASHE